MGGLGLWLSESNSSLTWQQRVSAVKEDKIIYMYVTNTTNGGCSLLTGKVYVFASECINEVTLLM